MMKIAAFSILIFCSFIADADIVSLTRSYTGQIDSYFKRGSDTYSLSGSTTNGTVQSFSTRLPYAGGMAITRPTDIMSSDGIRIATLFSRSYHVFTGYAQCWGMGYIEGSLHIGESLQYPIGTPLELKIDYATGYVGNMADYYHNTEVLLTDQNYNYLWYANHLTPTGAPENYTVPIISGTTYYFWMLQEFGTASNPVIPNGSIAAIAMALDFSIVPEPASAVLLLLGTVWVQSRHRQKLRHG